MANSNKPFGMSFQGIWGGSVTPSASRVGIPLVSTTAATYRGDPVKLASDGYCVPWTAGTGVSQLYGIFDGCEYQSASNGSWVQSPFYPGSGSATGAVQAYVIPCIQAPAPWFLAQTANSSTTAVAVTQASVGQNADVAMGTGSTLTGISGAYIDINTFNTTATLPFRIMALYGGNMPLGGASGPGSDTASAYNWVWVAANTEQNTGI